MTPIQKEQYLHEFRLLHKQWEVSHSHVQKISFQQFCILKSLQDKEHNNYQASHKIQDADMTKLLAIDSLLMHLKINQFLIVMKKNTDKETAVAVKSLVHQVSLSLNLSKKHHDRMEGLLNHYINSSMLSLQDSYMHQQYHCRKKVEVKIKEWVEEINEKVEQRKMKKVVAEGIFKSTKELFSSQSPLANKVLMDIMLNCQSKAEMKSKAKIFKW